MMRSRPGLTMLVCLAVFTLTTQSSAAVIHPVSYEMPNGEVGRFEYFDQSYDGDGDKATPLSALNNGVGELTDGVVPETSWNDTPEPFVGWSSIDPTIRVDFGDEYLIESAAFFFDDTEGDGNVVAPTQVSVTDGTTTRTLNLQDTPDRGRFIVRLDELDMRGTWAEASIQRGDGWVMLGELRFEGQLVPEPSAIMLLSCGLFVFAWCRGMRSLDADGC